MVKLSFPASGQRDAVGYGHGLPMRPGEGDLDSSRGGSEAVEQRLVEHRSRRWIRSVREDRAGCRPPLPHQEESDGQDEHGASSSPQHAREDRCADEHAESNNVAAERIWCHEHDCGDRCVKRACDAHGPVGGEPSDNNARGEREGCFGPCERERTAFRKQCCGDRDGRDGKHRHSRGPAVAGGDK